MTQSEPHDGIIEVDGKAYRTTRSIANAKKIAYTSLDYWMRHCGMPFIKVGIGRLIPIAEFDEWFSAVRPTIRRGNPNWGKKAQPIPQQVRSKMHASNLRSEHHQPDTPDAQETFRQLCDILTRLPPDTQETTVPVSLLYAALHFVEARLDK